MGREVAHEIIKEHAVAAALLMREGKGDGLVLLERLAGDPRFPGQLSELTTIRDSVLDTIGTIDQQIASFCAKVDTLGTDRPGAAYRGAEIR